LMGVCETGLLECTSWSFGVFSCIALPANVIDACFYYGDPLRCHYSWAFLLCGYYRVWLGSKSSTICCVYYGGE